MSSFAIRSSRAGEGGAPPVATVIGRWTRAGSAAGSAASMVNTVGAALKWVTR